MTSSEEPLRVADPRLLGRFQVQARLAEREAGVVFLGVGGGGEPAAIVVLLPAAAADSAVRGRFEAAIGSLAEDGKMLDAGPRDPMPWAAIPHEPGATLDDPYRLLDDAALTGRAEENGKGPAFAPHWTPEPGTVAWSEPPGFTPPQPPPPASKPSSLPSIVAVLCVIGVIAVIGLVAVSYLNEDSVTPPVAGPIASAPRTPAPTVPERGGGPGPVAGPKYGQGEKTYHMRLDGLPFEFDAPGTWGCMNSDRAPFDSRYTCVDEGGTFPPSGSGAGGFVAVQKCPRTCGDAERKALRKQFPIDEEDWRRTDATTMYSEVEGRDEDDERAVRLAMSHVFASHPGGTPDTAVAVQFTGPLDQKTTMQKFINELRERTP